MVCSGREKRLAPCAAGLVQHRCTAREPKEQSMKEGEVAESFGVVGDCSVCGKVLPYQAPVLLL